MRPSMRGGRPPLGHGRAALTMLVLSAALAGSTTVEGQELDQGIGYVLGDTLAPVQVVEFGDFACSACAQFWRETWPSVRRELVESGRVRWRHVPMVIGFDRGDDAANAAECAADQGEFWSMHDRLYANQPEWARGRGHHEVFQRYAVEIGLDADEFAECYEDEQGEDRTDDANQAARRARVRGTPTFFVDGTAAPGAITFETLLALVEEAERAGSGR